MNKRECIEMIKIEQEKSWEAPTDFAKRAKAYEKAKQICAENGYVDECFSDLWNKATDERARETPQKRYDAAHKTRIYIDCFSPSEDDILNKLREQPNKSGYIKKLIREDISRNV